MREKRGNTGKLKFDFNPSSVLEIQFDSDTEWFRVTAEYFRSFDGNRRITYYGGKESSYSLEYVGPLYIWGTNTEVERKNTSQLISGEKYELYLKNSKNRS